VSNKHYLEHTAPLFKLIKILTYQQLITYSKLNFMHSVTYKYCPTSFSDIRKTNYECNDIPDLRNANLLSVPYPRIEMFKKSPIYYLPKLWNALDATKYQQNKTTFRISIKDKLFNKPNFFKIPTK
jgi:hypothetical protein